MDGGKEHPERFLPLLVDGPKVATPDDSNHKKSPRDEAQAFQLVTSNWSGRPDSNRRPSAPQADALPGCATPRSLLQPATVAAGCRL